MPRTAIPPPIDQRGRRGVAVAVIVGMVLRRGLGREWRAIRDGYDMSAASGVGKG
jgi:hypothetical protein